MGRAFSSVEVEVSNWEKYNPRRDLKSTSWLRLNNDLFEHPDFFEFSHAELLVWIYVLTLASKGQNAAVSINYSRAEKLAKLKKASIDSAILKLEQIHCVRKCDADDTQTSHYERNERNERTNVTERNGTNAPEQCAVAHGLAGACPPDSLNNLASLFLERKVKTSIQEAWLSAYPDHPWIVQQVFKALAWEEANPKKRKLNFGLFVSNWLARGWDQHAKSFTSQPARKDIRDILGEEAQ